MANNSPILVPPPPPTNMNTTLVHLAQNAQLKDSRWLTLEVCREYQRSKCSRTENECKFAHPPTHVEVTNGRVVCCYDSIKGKCQRKEPPCKYLHPPQHLREQLLQNGRNNLILKNIQMQILGQTFATQSGLPSGGLIPIGLDPITAASMLTATPSYVTHDALFSVLTQPTSLNSIPAGLQPYLTTTTCGLPSAFGPFLSGSMPCNATVTMADLLLAAQSTPQMIQSSSGNSTVTSHGLQLTNCLTSPSLSFSLAGTAVPPSSGHKSMVSMAGHGCSGAAMESNHLENMGIYPYTLTTAPKRPAVADIKSGLPMYQAGPSPVAIAAYQHALANSGMHLQSTTQQTFFPTAYSPALKLHQFLQ